MKQKIKSQDWVSLALDICPDCEKLGLIVEQQENISAILTCPRCGSKYWVSPIRDRGTRKLI